jgi:hypothetical protein
MFSQHISIQCMDCLKTEKLLLKVLHIIKLSIFLIMIKIIITFTFTSMIIKKMFFRHGLNLKII